MRDQASGAALVRSYLQTYAAWMTSVGCDPDECVYLNCECNLPTVAGNDLLAGATTGCPPGLKTAVARWAAAPQSLRVISLHVARPNGLGPWAWHPTWRLAPVAFWLRDIDRPVVWVEVPHPFSSAPEPLPLLAVHQDDAPRVATMLLAWAQRDTPCINVVDGRDVPLPPDGYRWDRLTLAPDVLRCVRDDFEAFLARQSWYDEHGLPFRRNYLLWGPPGNGKTTLVRTLACHPNVHAFALNNRQSLTASRLSMLFEISSQYAPALVLLEDLDRVNGLVGPEPKESGVVRALLSYLDGLSSTDGTIVVATANNPQVFASPAIQRPGRFDQIVHFPPPDAGLREHYFRRYLPSANLDALVHATSGFSFAQLQEVVIRATSHESPRDLLIAANAIRHRTANNTVGFREST